MKTHCILPTILLALPLSANAAIINLSLGTAAQSTTLSSFVAGNAIDEVNNFTHTSGGDANATWQVLLTEPFSFNEVVSGSDQNWTVIFRSKLE